MPNASRCSFSILWVSLILATASPSLALDEPDGRVEIRLVDAHDHPLAGVEAKLVPREPPGTDRSAASDEDGKIVFEGLEPGIYELHWIDIDLLQPLKDQPLQGLRIEPGTLLRIEVDPVEGLFFDHVEAASWKRVSTGGRGLVSVLEVQDLRDFRIGVEGRTVLGVLEDMAGAATLETGEDAAPRVFGATESDNLYRIDGADISDPWLGIPGHDLPFDALEAVEIDPVGMDPRFGRALGAVVSLVTKSGSDRTRGTIHLDHRDDDWQEPGAHFESDGENQRTSLSATLGGRLVRERLWAFGATRGRLERTTPAEAILTRADDGRHHLLKLDADLPMAGQMALRWTRDRTEIDRANAFPGVLEAAASQIRRQTSLLHLSYRSRPRPLWQWRAFVADGQSEDEEGPQSGDLDAPSVFDDHLGLFLGNHDSMEALDLERVQAGLTFEGSSGTQDEHRIELGLEAHDVRGQTRHFLTGGLWIRGTSAPGPGGDADGDGFGALLMVRDYPPENGRLRARGNGRITSLWARDSWSILEGLTLELGWRWDRMTYATASEDPRFDHLRVDVHQPRLSLAWRPGKWKRSLVHVGWGRFSGPPSAGLGALFLDAHQGTQVLLGLDYLCPVFGLCDEVEIRRQLPGDVVDFDGDPFYPYQTTGQERVRPMGSLESPYSELRTVGFEHRFRSGSRIGLDHVHETTRRLLEDTCEANRFTFADADPNPLDPTLHTPLDGCSSYLVGNLAGLDRSYRAWILRSEGREHLGWGAAESLRWRFSWTWSKSRGNVESSALEAQASRAYDSFPRDFWNLDGWTADDRRQRARLAAFLPLPEGFEIALEALWQSGGPLDRRAGCERLQTASPDDLIGAGIDPLAPLLCGQEISGSLRLDPRGRFRGDPFYQLDLELRKHIQIRNLDFGLRLAVINVLDTELPTHYFGLELEPRRSWGEIQGRQQPRRFELALRIELAGD